ncbi:hypothetical protein [Chondrinema litorale]|uniref:hypothetical protein n=1 Tax=Chondrinema litorale TaxID=2994555 RepID=UPI0025438D90|nr:hypothetical protein [Chondrinema litorale]UZR99013.1 hypothetical protein OQ292_33995 [Chondrinema litorale]
MGNLSLESQEKELLEKLTALTQKYGLNATKSQQEEVISIGKELEKVRKKLGK